MKVLTSRVVLFAIVSALIVGNPMVSRAEIDDVYKTVASKAYVDDEVSTKQNVIPHVAAGTTATKIVTYPGAGASDGAIGELTVDTSSFYTTDDSHVPSSKLVASRDVRSHTVNGAPLSNMASYFYGEGDGDSDVLAKTVLINSIDSRENESTPTGQMITVQPNKTALRGNITLKLNKFNASPVYYKGDVLNDDDAPKVWNSKYPSTFVFDGSNWVFMGNGQLDTDTTYASMSVSEGTTGTATTQRSLTAQNLKQIIQGTKLYGVDITATSQVNANNTITESIGQLQGQINAIPNYGTNTVNGAPLSNSASVFFDGAAGGSANSPDKTASIPSITTLSAGTIITVQPQITSDIIEGATYSLRLNNFDHATIYYNGAALDAKDAPNIWNAKYPSTFVYDGTNWVFAGYGFDKDTNTTYASMGVSEGTTGTATAQRSLTAQNLKQIIQGTTLTGVDTTATAEVTASDTVTSGIGKLQGQVSTKQNKIAATSDGTDNTPNYVYDAATNPTADGSVVTTGATDGTVGQRGIATAPVSDGNGGYSNGDWLPTVNAMMSQINDATETLVWNSAQHPAAINAYSTVFGNGTYNWPAGTGDHLVTGSFLANALAEKQMKLPGKFDDAKGNTVIKLGTAGRAIRMYTTAAGNEALTNRRNADDVITYINGTKTLAEFQTSNFGAEDSSTINQNNNYIKEALVSLETLKDVYSELNTKITNNALPTGTAGTVVTYNGTNAETGVQEFTETAIYDTANAYDASTDADRLATAGFVETKQNKIAATSDGTDNTPNYVYDATTNPTADGSVVTTGATDGTVGQRGIATAPNYDTNDNLTNGDWLPTMSAVKSMVSGSDVSSHLVNGQALSNNQITLYGTSDSTSGQKNVTLYDYSDPDNPTPIQMDALVPGMVFVVKPTVDHQPNAALASMRIVNVYGTAGRKGVKYRGGNIPVDLAPKIWKADVPTVWVYDGTSFNYVSGGLDSGLRTVDWDENRHPTAINTYNADFDGATGHWWSIEAGGLVKGETFAKSLALKQNVLPAQASGAPVTIPTYPAYGTSDGVIGKMYLDTSSLYTANDEHFPSSKLINTTLSSYVPKSDVLNTNDTNSYLADYNSAPSWATTNGVASLYRVPGAASGSNWAATAMSRWANDENVPTMDTLANSLAGLYDAVGDSINSQILDYDETGRSITNATIPVPSQIEYTGDRSLSDGNQLFWLPQLNNAGVEEATRLLKNYSDEKIVPTMDELAFALNGVLQTHETTKEWQEVVDFYRVPASSLFDVAKAIEASDNNAVVALNRSGYLQTFAPTLEALMNESYALYQAIDTKQNKLSGTNGNLVTYGATPGATGSKAIATTITDDANTVPNTQAVYNAVNARQNVIPVAGKYRSSNTATSDTTISDWTATNIKGTALVTKPTSSDGVVGERKIFEAGDTYTDNIKTNIQIATIGAVMENTFTKTCAEYKPGTIGETAANCWLWEITSNNVTPATCSVNGTGCTSDTDCCSGYCNNARPSVCAEQTAACLNPTSCRSNSDCCDGYSCIGNSTVRTCVNFSSGT